MSEKDSNTKSEYPEPPQLSDQEKIKFLEMALKDAPDGQMKDSMRKELNYLLNKQEDNT